MARKVGKIREVCRQTMRDGLVYSLVGGIDLGQIECLSQLWGQNGMECTQCGSEILSW